MLRKYTISVEKSDYVGYTDGAMYINVEHIVAVAPSGGADEGTCVWLAGIDEPFYVHESVDDVMVSIVRQKR